MVRIRVRARIVISQGQAEDLERRSLLLDDKAAVPCIQALTRAISPHMTKMIAALEIEWLTSYPSML